MSVGSAGCLALLSIMQMRLGPLFFSPSARLSPDAAVVLDLRDHHHDHDDEDERQIPEDVR
jgi:hypothetical protein